MLKNILIIVSVILSFGIVWVLTGGGNTGNSSEIVDSEMHSAVSQQEKEQHIKILARGGYTPNQINALANKATVLEIETRGTYDCSSTISIPAMDYRNNLPPTGSTKITISPKKAKDSLDLLCGMGMYRATIQFR